MCFLTGKRIIDEVAAGRIIIDPFDAKYVGTNSCDLHWDRTFRIYKEHVLDMRKLNETVEVEIPDDGMVIYPGTVHLMATIEVAGSGIYVPTLHGRSSVGRLGLTVEVSAGFGDTGFGLGREQWTLEVVPTQPVRIYPGLRVCQVAFSTVVGEITEYDGRYKKQRGPVGSRFEQE